MKKLVYFMTAVAVLAMSLTSCKKEKKDEPKEPEAFQFAVSGITGNGAMIVVTPADAKATYAYAVLEKEEFAKYADNASVAADMVAGIKAQMEEYEGWYGFADFLCQGKDTISCYYSCTEKTEYVFVVATMDAEKEAWAGVLASCNFTTIEQDPYEGEPTEASALSVTTAMVSKIIGDTLYAYYYGDYYEIGNANEFYLELPTFEFWDYGFGLVLDLNQAAGTTELEPGEFEVSSVPGVGKILAGYTDGIYSYGSNYVHIADGGLSVGYYYIVGGKLTVAKDGDNTTIKGQLTTKYGSTIDVDYSGVVVGVDDSEEEPADAPAKAPVRRSARK